MYNAQMTKTNKIVPAPTISIIFTILLTLSFFWRISWLFTYRLTMIMIISMRMLRSRMRKLVPSIDARREGEGRYFGEDTHRRNIIRNLDTSLEKSQLFIDSRKSRLKYLGVWALRGMKPAQRQMKETRYWGIIIALQYFDVFLLRWMEYVISGIHTFLTFELILIISIDRCKAPGNIRKGPRFSWMGLL